MTFLSLQNVTGNEMNELGWRNGRSFQFATQQGHLKSVYPKRTALCVVHNIIRYIISTMYNGKKYMCKKWQIFVIIVA